MRFYTIFIQTTVIPSGTCYRKCWGQNSSSVRLTSTERKRAYCTTLSSNPRDKQATHIGLSSRYTTGSHVTYRSPVQWMYPRVPFDLVTSSVVFCGSTKWITCIRILSIWLTMINSYFDFQYKYTHYCMAKCRLRGLFISKGHTGLHRSNITSVMTSHTLQTTHFTTPN
jgi:hypothetical protein